jgi:O-succinylbenzoic acid--CoA ligase
VIVPDWLAVQARMRPDHVALIAPEGRRTFAELEASVAARARRLRAAGVERGTRVASLLPNGLALAELVHAVPRAGGVLVLLDPRLTPAEVRRDLARSGARLVVAPGGHHPAAAAAGARVLDDAPCVPDAHQPAGAGEPTLDLAAPHTIVFTSGSSGVPKGVVLTAGNHWWSATGSALRLGVSPADRWLACLPLWHVGGLAVVLRGVVQGTTVVLHRGFDAGAVAEALAADSISVVSVVPTGLRRLLAAWGERPPPPSLRCVLVGGAAASAALLAEAFERGWPVTPTYGCTEAASQVATAVPGAGPRGAGVVGAPLLPTRVRVVDAGGTPVAPGTPGELQVRSPTVAGHHLAADGGVEDALVDGWLRTGDLGSLAADGALTVLGRRDDVIVSGGENVAPAEVEDVLACVPGVREVAVCGSADPEWGQVVTAWVVPSDDAHPPTLEALRAAARTALAPHKLPRRLELVRELPRTAAGKLRRRALGTAPARA